MQSFPVYPVANPRVHMEGCWVSEGADRIMGWIKGARRGCCGVEREREGFVFDVTRKRLLLLM